MPGFLRINSSLTANGSQLCMDYHDGKYGVNTDPQRGADTFIPFSNGIPILNRCAYAYAGFNRSDTLGNDCKAVIFLNIGTNIDICCINNKSITSSGYAYEIQSALNGKRNLIIYKCKKGDQFTFVNDSVGVTFDMITITE